MTDTSALIEIFKKEAKKLLKQFQANDAEALARVQKVLKDTHEVTLMRVQHVIAVEHGFDKWECLIKASSVELSRAIVDGDRRTPLGNFFRGRGLIPTPPHFDEFAEMWDKMTMQEQQQYLKEDARKRFGTV